MNEPSDDITKEYVEGFGMITTPDGEIIRQDKIRVMSPFEIKQREELNRANTSENLRKRVLSQLNGGFTPLEDLPKLNHY